MGIQTLTLDAPVADEIVSRAREIAAGLIARQAETEERRSYAPDTHEAFKAAGLYKIMVPKRYGGLELGVHPFYEVVMELCRACPSTGWQFCLGASHCVTFTSLYPEAVQSEVYGDGHFLCAATARPQGEARRAEGGWIISGTWNYASGIPYSTHFMGHTRPRQEDGSLGAPMIFIAPASSWTMLDDWGAQIGRKGSGSNSVRLDEVFIAERFVREDTNLLTYQVDGSWPADRRPAESSPIYFGGTRSFLTLEGASLAIGTAWGAVDVYGDYMLSKPTARPPIGPRSEDPDYLMWYGQALGKLETAKAVFANLLDQWVEAARRNMEGIAAISYYDEWKFAAMRAEIEKLSWEACADNLFRTAGSSAMNDGERFQRIYRDMSMARAHAVQTWFEGTARDLAREALEARRRGASANHSESRA